MSWIAGVDGCPSGWFRVSRETRSGELHFEVVPSAIDLVTRRPHPVLIAIDVPIGLPEAGDRACDKAARAALGRPRASSVFPAPIRSAINASTRQEASALTQVADGRRVGVQTWCILPKIREVDRALSAESELRRTMREVHPEVSFWAWNGRVAMSERKKTKKGRAARLRLAEDWLGAGVLDAARGDYLKKHLADDDILDAIAALWTAHRIEEGVATSLPAESPVDRVGLKMEILY